MPCLVLGEIMRTTNSGEVILDREDSERLSKLIEWASQFVISIDHITVQEAAQFVQDWKATSMAFLSHGVPAARADRI
jgi:hypothetical protein